MIASNLIDENQADLDVTDTVSKANELFDKLKLRQLPIFKNNKFIGLIHQVDLKQASDEAILSELSLNITEQKVQAQQHLFEALSYFEKENLSLLPVINSDDEYIGCIHHHIILKKVCEWLNTNRIGGLLHLEVPIHDYSLSQIAQIIESEGAKILSSLCTQSESSPNKLTIILNINHNELSGIIETFKRYGYTVRASFHTNIYNKGLNERFDSFMHYLNI